MEGISLTGKTKLYCLLGDPVEHSLSPAMYNYCFAKQGVDACYLAFRVSAQDMPEAMTGLKKLGIAGANVTMPGKKIAAKLADVATPAVQITGAANVLLLENGGLTAYNTDGTGLFLYLKGAGFNVAGKTLILLGAGGAAASIVAAAALEGAARIEVFNRPGPSFDAMRQVFQNVRLFCPEVHLDLHETTAIEQLTAAMRAADILINASSVGMAPAVQLSPLPSAVALPADLPVCDIIYNPEETLLLRQAAAAGATCWNGKGMLLGQGAEAYRIFTGLAMPMEEVGREIFGL